MAPPDFTPIERRGVRQTATADPAGRFGQRTHRAGRTDPRQIAHACLANQIAA